MRGREIGYKENLRRSEVLEVVRNFNGDRRQDLAGFLWLFSRNVGRY
jgi:hypothetical protein